MSCVNGICSVPSAPSIIDAAAILIDSDTVQLVVNGQDVDGDAVGLEFLAFESSGAPLDIDGDGSTDSIWQPFDTSVLGQTDFSATVTVTGLSGLGVADFSLLIYDATDLTSAPPFICSVE